MTVRLLYTVAAFGAVVIGITLWVWGQPLICTCGYVRLWVGFIWSGENSQQIADWYSLSHAIHGMLIVLAGFLSRGWITYPIQLFLAITTGMAWEIVEHTDWVLGQFREVTIYQGYIGDSVLNAVADYGFMWLGFAAARAIGALWTVILIVVMEVSAAVFGRDCLTFATLMLIYPIEAIDAYQQETNPNRVPLQ